MNTYFNINYEFDKQEVHRAIEEALKGYITLEKFEHRMCEGLSTIANAQPKTE